MVPSRQSSKGSLLLWSPAGKTAKVLCDSELCFRIDRLTRFSAILNYVPSRQNSKGSLYDSELRSLADGAAITINVPVVYMGRYEVALSGNKCYGVCIVN